MYQCAKPCEETVYDAKIVRYGDEDPYGGDIRLNFYFNRLEYTRSTEIPAYDKTRFMADVGGVVGLLVGCSLLSVFEVVICVGLYVVDIVLMFLLKFY